MAKKPQKNSVHLESSTLSGCVRSSLPCCMAHSFSKTLIQFQQNCLCPLLMATDTATRQPPTSPQECTIVNICSWLWSLKWVSQAVLLSGLGRGDLSWAHAWVQWAMGWLAGAHTTLFCLCLVLQQASRACGCDRSMQGPLNHRLGAGNRRFHHILLARASPKANPDSKGRKTNSTSSMERLQGHVIRREKPKERWNMGSFYNQLTTLIWTYRKRLSYFLANVLGFFEVALSGCRSVTLASQSVTLDTFCLCCWQSVLSCCLWCHGCGTGQFICSWLCQGQSVSSPRHQYHWKNSSDRQLQHGRPKAGQFHVLSMWPAPNWWMNGI